MIVQACLNGARGKVEHPRLPLTVEATASDAADCVAAGAGELHIHARGSDGRERLSAQELSPVVLFAYFFLRAAPFRTGQVAPALQGKVPPVNSLRE